MHRSENSHNKARTVTFDNNRRNSHSSLDNAEARLLQLLQQADVLAALTNPKIATALLSKQQEQPQPRRLDLIDILTKQRNQRNQREQAIQNAYRWGKEEAIMSLIQAGALNAALLKRNRSDVEPMLKEDSTKNTAVEDIGSTSRNKNEPYFDAAQLEDPDPSQRVVRGGVKEAFPEKLHRMLKEVEATNETDVCSWAPHGRAFCIIYEERFVRDVMPRYFKQSRLSSFQRQLDLYGFTKISSGPDQGSFYHNLFLKGRSALTIHMRRVGAPKSSKRKLVKLEQTKNGAPDFYSMEPVSKSKENKATLASCSPSNSTTIDIVPPLPMTVSNEETSQFADADDS